MQIVLHRHHFGKLAIGLCDADTDRERRLAALNEEHLESDREMFYTVNSGGVNHPWGYKEHEIRVAITGDRMVFNEDRSGYVGIFAKAEFAVKGEVYLSYTFPDSVIGYGFPDPVKSAKQIISMAVEFGSCGTQQKDGCRWIVVDKRQVPKYHRWLLGRVMKDVQDAFVQGQEYFRMPQPKPKAV